MALIGNELFRLFLELSGLNQEKAAAELEMLMQRLNINPDTVTTEDIRRLMAAYLEQFDSDITGSLLMNSAVNFEKPEA
jgi:hypothetical protein